eukprot:gnl/MRDRNA2_/MRDRNA2_60312_c0_seq1.p1 gnl/MRDRNA2_/MRDRNA2_60312_c0~~gnl/MRDRNA2_/MRDRNA2_60312_c0_seq1.p1  ORF type:complete len:210 (+),score=2.01 gnl/MRDRNA2_/MRDRNA2_60312_c0_seq1:19-648(+)
MISNIIVEPHRQNGVFIARGKEDALVTKNIVPGYSLAGEKRLHVTDPKRPEKIEYRVWNPFRSKLAAAILGGLDNLCIKPGSKVLYLGASNGYTVSFISDIVGHTGIVYAVEHSHRLGQDLIGVAEKRGNIVPIIEDPRHPVRFRMLMPMVDTILSDLNQPDNAISLAKNADLFLKTGGHYMLVVKAGCIDPEEDPKVVFAKEIQKLQV